MSVRGSSKIPFPVDPALWTALVAGRLGLVLIACRLFLREQTRRVGFRGPGSIEMELKELCRAGPGQGSSRWK